jgi:hypothetical protein
MALSPKEREQIIEEETLRFETRQGLGGKHCSSRPCGGGGRWLWLVAGLALGYALHGVLGCCGGHACSMEGMGHHCTMGSMNGDSVEPGMPIPSGKGAAAPSKP